MRFNPVFVVVGEVFEGISDHNHPVDARPPVDGWRLAAGD
jgi:hypothetical protein